MKQEAEAQPFLHHRQRLVASKFMKYIVYLVILLCCYSLGYLSSSSFSSSSSSSSAAAGGAMISSSASDEATIIPAEKDDHSQFISRCARPMATTHVRQTIIDQLFKGVSPWEGFPPPHIIPLLHPNNIKGWGSKGAVFENLIREVQPKIIVEVGTFLGASALHMVNLTRELGLHDTQIICIDDFRGWPGFQYEVKEMNMLNGDVLLLQQFMQNVMQWKATESILMMPFASSSALEKLCQWGVFGDLVEVDASHDFHSAWSDIHRAYKILRPGGVIFGHDYYIASDNYGVKRAVHMFARNHNQTVQVDGQHWVIRSNPPPN